MKEIGGYFGLEELPGKEYHSAAIACNCGRSCLSLLLQGKQGMRLYLPYYNCDVVYDTCVRMCADIRQYHVDENFLPKIRDYDGGIVYVVKYYGILSDTELESFAQHYEHMIIDNSHDFYSKAVSYADSFNTCRKFFGVPDGAYVYSRKILKEPSKRSKVLGRMNSLVGRIEDGASPHYKEFQENDEKFDDEGVLGMSQFSHNILRAIDYDEVAKTRENNYRFLDDMLGNANLLKKNVKRVPFVYPFLTQRSDELRHHLISEKIYVPKYWNSRFENEFDMIEKEFSAQILPLPIDQRYSLEDMERVGRLVLHFLRGKKSG